MDLFSELEALCKGLKVFRKGVGGIQGNVIGFAKKSSLSNFHKYALPIGASGSNLMS